MTFGTTLVFYYKGKHETERPTLSKSYDPLKTVTPDIHSLISVVFLAVSKGRIHSLVAQSS